MSHKVVINACYGGYGLSKLVLEKLREKKGLEANQKLSAYTIDRTDLDLVAVVEELGEKANDSCTDLQIDLIPDEYFVHNCWDISEYDGLEHIELNDELLSLKKADLSNKTKIAELEAKVAELQEVIENLRDQEKNITELY